MVETMMAVGILFVALTALAFASLVGFKDIGLSRQRLVANQLANKVIEEVRGLSFTRVSQGLALSDVSGDSNILSCPDGRLYYKSCPSGDPNAEELVATSGLPSDGILVPHVATVSGSDYPATYTTRLYVTRVTLTSTSAYRVTAEVSWTSPQRAGVLSTIQNQTIVYQPEGTVDPGVGGGIGGGTFYFGTGSLSRGSVVVTPNSGVNGGTGITGLPSWDSLTENLDSVDANYAEQLVKKADAKFTLTGARQVVGGLETVSPEVQASVSADDDPTTPQGSSQSSSTLYQAGAATSLAGGGNKLEVVATTPGTPCPSRQPTPVWMTGFEYGAVSQLGGGLFTSLTGAPTADSSVKRNGSYSLKVTDASASTSINASKNIGGAGTNDIVLHVAVRIASNTGDIDDLLSIDAASGYDALLQYKSGKFGVAFYNGVSQTGGVLASTTASTGTWYTIDIKFHTNPEPRTINWQVDGVSQTSTSASSGANVSINNVYLGSTINSGIFTANYDDLVVSKTAGDYPIDDMAIKGLKPNGIGTNVNPTRFLEQNGGAIGALSWQQLNEVPLPTSTSGAKYIKQVTQDSTPTSYIEVNFEDPPENCVRGVSAYLDYWAAGTTTNVGSTYIYDGSTQSTVFSGDMSESSQFFKSAVVNAASSPWTLTAVNGLKARLGYSTDTTPNPYWDAMLLEYAVPSSAGGGGTPGSESGYTYAQTSGFLCTRPCAWAQELYNVNPAADVQIKADITGSGADQCQLYQFIPPTHGAAKSYAYADRFSDGLGTETIREYAVSWPGRHDFGGLCGGTGSAPPGWPGYFVRYDSGNTGNSSNCAVAEAGKASGAPYLCARNDTITFYNGSGTVTPFAPPANGTWSSQPATVAFTTSTGWRYDLSASLASGPSFTSSSPGGSGIADRTQSRAVVGSPVIGTINYKLTNPSSQVVINVTMTIDLGTLTAYGRYNP